jgi:hypothetical protein
MARAPLGAIFAHVLSPYYKEGIELDEEVITIVDDERRKEHCSPGAARRRCRRVVLRGAGRATARGAAVEQSADREGFAAGLSPAA